MANFDFLHEEHIAKLFYEFAENAIKAEEYVYSDPISCIMRCRRAIEFAVKWIYKHEKITMPFDGRLVSLLDGISFKRTLNNSDIEGRIEYIREKGNEGAHKTDSDARIAIGCVKNLFIVVDFLAQKYIKQYSPKKFDYKKLPVNGANADNNYFDELIEDNRRLTAEKKYLQYKIERQKTLQKQDYINIYAGWTEEEISDYVEKMLEAVDWGWGDCMRYDLNRQDEENYIADNVLFYVHWDTLEMDEKQPLAVVEVFKPGYDIVDAEKMATTFSKRLHDKFGLDYYPLRFVSNGLETFFLDATTIRNRKVGSVFGQTGIKRALDFKRETGNIDLSKLNLSSECELKQCTKDAVKSIAHEINDGIMRHLVVMPVYAERINIAKSIIDLLVRAKRLSCVLYVVEEEYEVDGAVENLRQSNVCLTVRKLSSSEIDYHGCRCIEGILVMSLASLTIAMNTFLEDDIHYYFVANDFDLIVIENCSADILEKYAPIIDYFYAHKVGFTSANIHDLSCGPYEIFCDKNSRPTYIYTYEQAYKDTVLVPSYNYEMSTRLLESGVNYKQLSIREKECYKTSYVNEDIPQKISSEDFACKYINEPTIKIKIEDVMERGLRAPNCEHIGKTVLYVENKSSIESIVNRFREEYPQLGYDFIQYYDDNDNNSKSILDKFCNADNYPFVLVVNHPSRNLQGIPCCLNVVLFDGVCSRSCYEKIVSIGAYAIDKASEVTNSKNLMLKKTKYHIIDYGKNIDKFRENPHYSIFRNTTHYNAFNTLIRKIANIQNDRHLSATQKRQFCNGIIRELCSTISSINVKGYPARVHLAYIGKYKHPEVFEHIFETDIREISEEVYPCIVSCYSWIEYAINCIFLDYQLEIFDDENKMEEFKAYRINLMSVFGKYIQQCDNVALRKLMTLLCDKKKITAKYIEALRKCLIEVIKSIENLDQIQKVYYNEPKFLHVTDFIKELSQGIALPEWTEDNILMVNSDQIEHYLKDKAYKSNEFIMLTDCKH